VDRGVIALLSAALTGLFTAQLVAVLHMELGATGFFVAPAVFVLALGSGLLSRVHLPYLGACFGVVLCSLLRAPLDAALFALFGAGTTRLVLSCALGLAPLGFLLGRQLAPQLERAVLGATLGASLAALAVACGAVAWMPVVWLSGPLVAVALASLSEAGRHRGGAPEHAAGERSAWPALPFACCTTLLWMALARHLPAYVEPSGPAGVESLLALLLPGLLVAVPARVVCSRGGVMARGVQSLGLLALALAAWNLAQSLSLYAFPPLYAQRTWEWRGFAQTWAPWLDEWRAWLLIFGGWSAAGFGLCLGGLGRRAAGPALLGVGLAVFAQEYVARGSGFASQQVLVVAAGVAACGAVWPWQRRAWLLTPLALAALLLFPTERRDEWARVRRVGEMSATLAARTRPGEVLMFGTGGPDNISPDGRDAYRRSFTGDRRAHAHPLDEPASPAAFESEEPVSSIQFQGLRLAGLGLHEGVMPLGPEGSLGRLLRAFHRAGSALVLGHGAELLAADVLSLDPGRELAWSSDMPLGPRVTTLLLTELGHTPDIGTRLEALQREELDAALDERAWDLVVSSPERALSPLSGRTLGLERLQRARASLTRGGRCLAFVEITDLDARALAGRLGAFGAVFGERSLAMLSLRELSAPTVVLVGWRDDAGCPDLGELRARLRCAQRTGTRPIVSTADDVAGLVVFNGRELASLGTTVALHRDLRPLPAGRGPRGWTALAALERFAFDPAPALPGWPSAPAATWRLLAAMGAFAPHRFDVDRPTGSMSVQISADTDWEAFERLVDALAAVSVEAPGHPLLPVVVAALLEPLSVHAEYGRFADAWKRLHADALPGWRLPQALAHVAEAMQQEELATQAAERAKAWAASRDASGGASGAR